MSSRPTAPAADTIEVGGDLTVNRIGFGAMRITGTGIWGDPPDRERARAALLRAVELDVNFIDTADSYGPEVSEILIAETPVPAAGNRMAAPSTSGRRAKGSLRRLRLEQIPLYQFHRPDPNVPIAESIGALAELKDEGRSVTPGCRTCRRSNSARLSGSRRSCRYRIAITRATGNQNR